MARDRLLIVEDDPQMQRLLSSQLAARGYEVRVVGDGSKGLEAAGREEFDLVLLDITMPGMDGLEVCRNLREWSKVPIILVTATDAPATKVTALEMGADDYLTKPFHTGELVARIRAVLRRASSEGKPEPTVIEVGELRIDVPAREVRRGEEVVHLTRTEFDLLRELALYPDRVLTYGHLLEAVWGDGYDDVRAVHVHICNLRRKLEPDPTGPRHIVAVPGVGYRFRHLDD